MRSIKSSLVGLVLAGILALAPTAAFAHGGGGGGHGGGFGGGGMPGRGFGSRGFHDGFHHHDFRRDHDRSFFGTGIGFDAPSGYLDYPDYGYYGYNTSDYDYSETIVAVQKELAKLGYYNGPIDGTVGPQTETAIRWFQSVDKLPETGQIDDPTLQALRIS